jgi:two-component system, chemotaxis family, response regulator Rcp1
MSNNSLDSLRPAEILLVEDNDNDVELTRIGFERSKFAVRLHRVANGEECMAFLRKEGKYADVPAPDLILLDLNMPRMNGQEVLEEVGRDERLKHLPIVVLTSSDAEKDVLESYKLRCSSYLLKPVDFEGFVKVVQSLGDYWLTLVVLPSAAASRK